MSSQQTHAAPATGEMHSPLPWRIIADCFIHDPAGNPVGGTPYGKNDLANAAFIVRACNNHAALVTVVKLLRDIIATDHRVFGSYSPELNYASQTLLDAEGRDHA
jgi:hypothetical protein